MSTFLGVLIVIGKILLVILCIILLLVCLVLFVPFRYHIVTDGDSTKGPSVRADIRLSWLLQLIAFDISVRKGIEGEADGMKKELLICGISPSRVMKNRAQKKKEKTKEKKKEQLEQIKEEDPQKYEELRENALRKKQQKEEERKRKIEEAEAAKKAEAEALQEARDRKEKLKLYAKMKLGVLRRAIIAGNQTIRVAFAWVIYGITVITSSSGYIFSMFSDFLGKVREFRDKVWTITGFATDPRTQTALALLLDKVKKLLLHLLPKKASGQVDFDCGDPCTTGQVLAAVSAFFPVYGGRVRINPGFGDVFYADGNLDLRGRLFVFYVIYQVLTLILNKNVRYVYHFYKESKEAG
ncbi:MAG: hypothetical protein J6D14_00745 [Lachnospiraceae bacterium]|nr:hypothetical protein [Lachnospiraceae bacterium]